MPEAAQQLTMTARLRQPHGLVNPAGFDYERWLLLERFVATGYVRAMHATAPRPAGFAPWLLAVRASLKRSIAAQGYGPSVTALIGALAIGDRSGFSAGDWAAFRRTGTSHLVAISGLHIGIVAICVLMLTNRALRMAAIEWRDAAQRLASAAALLAAVAYAALAGFSVSTIRAVVMFAAALVIVNLGRDVNRAQGFALAALLIVMLDPMATLGGSFWLSFGAVGCLLLTTSQRTLRSRNRAWPGRLARIVSVQFAVTLMAMPASAVLFGELSLSSLPVNLLAIPLFSLLLVPYVLVCVVVELCIGAPAWAWSAAGWLASAVLNALEWIAALPGSSLVVPAPTSFVAAIGLIGAALAVWWRPAHSRVIGIVAVAPLLWPAQQRLPSGAVRLTVFDVGHGLASVIETRDHVVVYDAGARYASGFDVGDAVLLPYLRTAGSAQMLIVSHADNDHSGGAAALIAEYPDMTVVAGGAVGSVMWWPCVAGQQWVLDGVQFEIVHPAAQFSGSANDGSCVLRVMARGGSALLTGDIERAAEAALAAAGSIDVDVVIAPHHGSATSSTAPFVAATSPEVTIVSAGFRNRWNFPADEVVRRWCDIGSRVLVTGEHGAVEVVFGKDPPRVAGLRRTQPRFWRRNGAPRCGESPGVTL
jgi:competence protein ComEC